MAPPSPISPSHLIILMIMLSIQQTLSGIFLLLIEEFLKAGNGVILDEQLSYLADELFDLGRTNNTTLDEEGNVLPKRRKMIKYDRARASQCVYDDYFSPTPRFDDKSITIW